MIAPYPSRRGFNFTACKGSENSDTAGKIQRAINFFTGAEKMKDAEGRYYSYAEIEALEREYYAAGKTFKGEFEDYVATLWKPEEDAIKREYFEAGFKARSGECGCFSRETFAVNEYLKAYNSTKK